MNDQLPSEGIGEHPAPNVKLSALLGCGPCRILTSVLFLTHELFSGIQLFCDSLLDEFRVYRRRCLGIWIVCSHECVQLIYKCPNIIVKGFQFLQRNSHPIWTLKNALLVFTNFYPSSNFVGVVKSPLAVEVLIAPPMKFTESIHKILKNCHSIIRLLLGVKNGSEHIHNSVKVIAEGQISRKREILIEHLCQNNVEMKFDFAHHYGNFAQSGLVALSEFC